MCIDGRSAAEGVQEGVQQFDEEFEARLKGLKQQTQRNLVCFRYRCSCVYTSATGKCAMSAAVR